ncbi:MAG: hypothetical protein A2087_07775 [Spirochaetes bacterium GWD1_61_31]|nr:MAG: hypothetical protein A2Y37_07695 [Spirochaetes bacterium GWB1_60_80]OHD34301.1 MAG: hypothetical protein A2004_13055 [Spirochaetes bacterium GWC1_61_12]OHD40229.1 MAG: hypothetical protein A2087_07775 [Spirochaetes bacterium GWD1_61_31]OHD45723.1 MAG: hypothetical protein A2Y35_03330 [Spirochaetes bacterium GWE1_60_18]OHD59875.1 MAG: hypothetical protein A2Y32_00055 [Spirochaetes bacterium GWF1_60_12]HBO41982.1 hypothetical protein [Spirochaetaceae bacterium]
MALAIHTAAVDLSPILAVLIPGLGKVWDSESDPLMGFITDQVHSRYGCRPGFFLVGMIPAALTIAMLWLPVFLGTWKLPFNPKATARGSGFDTISLSSLLIGQIFVLPLYVAFCAGLSAGILTPWQVLPFGVDVDELITAKRCVGIYSGTIPWWGRRRRLGDYRARLPSG